MMFFPIHAQSIFPVLTENEGAQRVRFDLIRFYIFCLVSDSTPDSIIHFI